MMDQLPGNLLGPLLGFLFTVGTVLFIAFTAHRTERPGALEALQADARRLASGESSPGEPQGPAASGS